MSRNRYPLLGLRFVVVVFVTPLLMFGQANAQPSWEDLEAGDAFAQLTLVGRPFENPMVGRAVLHAVHWSEISEGLPGSDTIIALDLPDAGMAVEDGRQLHFEPERARELLAEAGFPEGLEIVMLLTPIEEPLGHLIELAPIMLEEVRIGVERIEVPATDVAAILAELVDAGRAVIRVELRLRLAIRINESFPIDSSNELSPPFVHKPIHECAAAVHVSGFVPHATVQVFANKTDLIGQAHPHFGFADISLNRTLHLNEKITAVQIVKGIKSAHSFTPVTVGPYPTVSGGFNKPVVGEDLYACGRVAPVGKLVESVQCQVFGNGVQIGSAESPGKWVAVWTRPLQDPEKVTARQIACRNEPAKTIQSPLSDPVVVKPAPSPVPPPYVHANSLIPGNDSVVVSKLFVGAEVSVFDGGAKVGGGWATGSANRVPIAQPLKSTSSIDAWQKLCKTSSKPPPVTPRGVLRAPQLVPPLCAGARYVRLRSTVVNAIVVVQSNGTTIAYGGAKDGDLILGLGTPLKVGETVTAVQYMGTTLSPVSVPVKVLAGLTAPAVEILGGEPFFLPEPGENAIDGPVFPRGRGSGPVINVQTCCDGVATAELLGPDGTSVARVPLTAVYPGFFTGRWDWSSTSGWKVPSDVPVGTYTMRVTSGCSQDPVSKKLYVIFDPQEVTAAARFAFNETGVFFTSGRGSDSADVYALHPDDQRIFKEAIRLTSGETDTYKASNKIMKWLVPYKYSPSFCNGGGLKKDPSKRFVYSICSMEYDVLKLLARADQLAQCSDSACLFVAMLRSIGIPAHPTTADAAREYGGASWGYDTWTEARIKGPSGEKWYAAHPHEGIYWTQRASAGSWGVASKSFNDLVIMASGSWKASEVTDWAPDVRFDYGTACREPDQTMKYQATWLEHLCESGPSGPAYWAKAHWTCSPAYSTDIHLRPERPVYRVGDLLRVAVRVDNPGEEPRHELLSVSLVVDRPETKVYGDDELPLGEHALSLAPGESVELEFEMELPRSLSAADIYDVRARLGDDYAAAPIEVRALFEAALELPDEMPVDEPFTIALSLDAATEEVVHAISAGLAVPFGVDVVEGDAYQRIIRLTPGESRTLVWQVVARVPTDAAAFVVEVSSASGGRTRLRGGLAIVSPSVPEQVSTIVAIPERG